MLAGGVGGARLARGLAAVLPGVDLTIIVNVGDDDTMYGAHVSADLDTVLYTLAGMEGPMGWGLRDDTFTVMERLAALGIDTTFRLGDRDLGTCLARTAAMARGTPLSEFTATLAVADGVACCILPASDDRVRTRVQIVGGDWLAFQDYFVTRGHRDEVMALAYHGATSALPAPGVLEAITKADVVVIAPSNPPLSIHPILAIPGIENAVESAGPVVAVSPLFGGKALKGPADRVMAALGLPLGNEGVLAAYDGLLTHLVIDDGDDADVAALDGPVRVMSTDTRIAEAADAARFAKWLLETV